MESNGLPAQLSVASSEALEHLCRQLRAAGRFAFDTEFVMEDRYSPEVCLVQVATESLAAVIDPLGGLDLAPLWALLADPSLEVIVHAGMEDVAMCRSCGGTTPTRVFDCQIACGLVGLTYPLSLSRMVRQLLNVHLHKSQTLTDWRRRPLSPEQLRYATEDVMYLPRIHRELADRLAAMGRTRWMDEEMAVFSKSRPPERASTESGFRLKGAGALDGLGLAIVRELAKTREELAARYDRPARAVIRDHLLVEIARHRWTSVAQFRTLRGLHLRKDGLEALAEAAKRARELPSEQWPKTAPPDDETEEESMLGMLAAAVLRAYCLDHRLAPQLVAARADIHAFVRAFLRDRNDGSALPLGRGWRAETVGQLIRELLAGRISVSVRGRGQDATIAMMPVPPAEAGLL